MIPCCDIVYLFGSLNRGGAETLLMDLFRKKDKLGYKIAAIHRKGGALEEDLKNTGVTFSLLFPKFPFDPVYLIRLRKRILGYKAKIVHAQQYLDAIYAKIALIGTKVKIVQTYHGYDYGLNKRGDAMIKFISKRIDCNIFVSKTQKGYFVGNLNLPESKVAVVYNGVDFSKLGDINKHEATSGVLRLGTVGNFVQGRDQYTLCKFLKVLKENNINYRFDFVGRKDEKNPGYFDKCHDFCVRNGLMESVRFLGSRTDVPELLKTWDAFLYSTDHDTFGLAVIEAIASGIPVFVNDWGVMREVTDNGELAVLYKTKDVEDLYKSFAGFISSPQRFFESSYHNAETIRSKFSIEQYILHLNNLYFKINRT